ncbi:MAG TPA: cyclic lactone autoinducer peptide [Syntrophomonadaceae bacterium]|nr:cyclic lactone autoinducer peptide [Syntrophomonadaceae bacterium]
MRKPLKVMMLQMVSVFLLFVAAGGMKPACWLLWYQPKLPE